MSLAVRQDGELCWIDSGARALRVDEDNPSAMATFVLVHGSFHGAWCWERLTPLLTEHGHRVVAPNLPGSGDDPAPLENAGLTSYATRVAARIDEIPGPVILVGHSMGGIVASQIAQWRSERLAAVVYICGLLLRSGETLAAFLEAHAQLGIEDLVLANMKLSADRALATFPQALAGEVFYNCCTPADAEWAASQLRPQATRVYADTLDLSPQRFGGLRKFYIESLRDRAVSPVYQRRMVERTACEAVFTLDTDHSPFLSRPSQLRDLLLTVAKRVE
jgi:pimeloyl-ACP methyl ester carboxylesterase